jgi:hypothetical protein
MKKVGQMMLSKLENPDFSMGVLLLLISYIGSGSPKQSISPLPELRELAQSIREALVLGR